MLPADPREAELVAEAARVLARLIVAVEHADHPEIASQVGRLLTAVAKYNHAMRERPSDAALRRAVLRQG